MARILFTWELGGGMGHVAPYLPLAKGLRDKGHEVAFVLRDLYSAETSLGQNNFPYFQAPVALSPAENRNPSPHIFAQLLHNVGYGNVELLTGLVKAWRQLFDFYKPDLLICDHSPTALLAARTIECKKVVIGPGFFIPPDVTPSPLLRKIPEPDQAVLASDEARILDNINQVLKRIGAEPVNRITQLYDADDKILTTFRELDNYRAARQQEDVMYWGTGRSGLGVKPLWPAGQIEGERKRIFAYLGPFKTLPSLLRHLQQSQASVIIYSPQLGDAIKRQFASPTLYFASSPLDLEQTASSCDVAITNGAHTTTATFLKAGIPMLLLPIFHEQAMIAHNVEQIGAGLVSISQHPQEMIDKLQALLNDPRFRLAAETFKKQYADFDAVTLEQRMIDHVDALLTAP